MKFNQSIAISMGILLLALAPKGSARLGEGDSGDQKKEKKNDCVVLGIADILDAEGNVIGSVTSTQNSDGSITVDLNHSSVPGIPDTSFLGAPVTDASGQTCAIMATNISGSTTTSCALKSSSDDGKTVEFTRVDHETGRETVKATYRLRSSR